ncbi:MAG: GLPGLI family protein [Bacteroidetes bacterium]|nr:GLPGLI family protein [Bacteroidota bacterium]MBS1934554.1 GLPGLI family protein [Bacteroidota bacterium]
MKKILIAGIPVLLSCSLYGQQTSGTVMYERTIKMQMHISDDEQGDKVIPQTRVDRFVLSFANNQSVWKHSDDDMQNAETESSSNGVHIKMIAPGLDDITYVDFNTAHTVEQREMFGKTFIVSDSIRKLSWKLTGETQTLLGHICQKAIAQKPSKRMTMNMDNGKMQRKEVDDTVSIIAWFTSDIPVPAGPEVAGQVPGLILLLDVNDGKTLYKAVELKEKVNAADIKEPSKGKKVTTDQFKAEVAKMMDEMEKNNRGGGRMIRIQN